jgi:murein DD-endopeptidase MepM/ murein hydrolase activator NlpD
VNKLEKKKIFWFFLLFLCFGAVISIGQGKSSQKQASITLQDNFISVDSYFQPIENGLIIQQGNILSSLSSPLFVSSQTMGALSYEESKVEDKYILKHIVGEGETLSKISEKYNISIATILLANELDNSKIYPNQELLILPINGILHMVDNGETVDVIAKKYSGKKEEIINYNNLSSDGGIFIGDIIIVPNGKIKVQPISVASAPVAVTQNVVSVSNSYFIAPTKGIITQGPHYAYSSGGKAYYSAIDVANKIGTPIVASASGVTQIVKNVWPYGNYITILHPNGVVTLYAHLNSFAKGMISGKSVAQGEIIGYMGNTGRCISFPGGNGSHLHFETRGASNPLRNYSLGSTVSY